ncbi:MAG: PD-(D/E)XK nuclease family protein, partial [Alphaproteobacteria bacterium]
MNIFNIPHSSNALFVFVENFFPFSPHDIIFVPTMRAKRVLVDKILEKNQNKTLLLPNILSFDEAGTDAVFGEETDALSATRRNVLLTQLIQAKFPSYSLSRAMNWAEKLATLMDKMTFERLSLKSLISLVPEDLNNHYQQTLSFLKILLKSWPKILKHEGKKTRAEQQINGLEAIAEKISFYTKGHIFSIGSTGSLPTTRLLLNKIYQHKNGTIILHGFQKSSLKEQEEMDETHPYYGFKILLNELKISQENISFLEKENQKEILSRIAFLPSSETEQWQDFTITENIFNDISFAECENYSHEALTITCAIQEQKKKGKKSLIVTSDRDLVLHLKGCFSRLEIQAEDSLGCPFFETRFGKIIESFLDFLKEDSPSTFLTLIKQIENDKTQIFEFEQLLRNTPVQSLKNDLRPAFYLKSKKDQIENEIIFKNIQKKISLFRFPVQTDNYFANHLLFFIKTISQIYPLNDLDDLLLDLKKETCDWTVSWPDFLTILPLFLKDISFRKEFNKKADVLILGPIEARMQQADFTIIPSLNEGFFPKITQDDPFLNEAMRTQIGLPLRRRKVGLMALDFMAILASQNILFTRTKTIDGSPTIRSRFLERLETILEKNNQSFNKSKWIKIAKNFDKGTLFPIQKECKFAPPISARPQRLSVSAIELWLRNPYAFYAKYILKLRKINDFETDDSPRIFGNIIHDGLEELAKINDFSKKNIQKTFSQAIMKETLPLHQKLFWLKKAEKIADFISEYERTKPPHKKYAEKWGEAPLTETFTLFAKADRINLFSDGSIEIMDYKTGAIPKDKEVKSGLAPQLALEGYLVEQEGFDDIKGDVSSLTYLRLGKDDSGGEKKIFTDVPEILIGTLTRLKSLVLKYENKEQAYAANRDEAAEKDRD